MAAMSGRLAEKLRDGHDPRDSCGCHANAKMYCSMVPASPIERDGGIEWDDISSG
jgi:hypothetical protein